MPAVRLGYLIRAYHRPAQLARLVDRLDGPDISLFLHISGRTSVETHGEMRARLADRPNLHWTRRVATHYLGFSLVEATLAGIEAILATDDPPDYTFYLSGQDYPLRSPAAIREAVAARGRRGQLFHYALPSDEWRDEDGGLDRIRYWYFERLSYKTRQARLPLVRRRFPPGLVPYGGSAWWGLTPEGLEHIARFVRDKPDIVRFFRRTKMPDELLIPTILGNSEFAPTLVNDHIHYLDWSAGGAHPKTLGVEDFPRFAASGKLFARKFDAKSDPEVLDVIDRELLAAATVASA
jgi:hypothetical protein